MKIKMLVETKFAFDGIGHVIHTLAVDQVVETLSDKMAQDFVDCNLAVEVKAEKKKVVAAPVNKKLESAPINKAKKKAQSKKG